MLNAWRKFTKKQDEKPVFPMGVAPVDQNMQRKYAKGVQYNMKLIIKGDRNTGKSVLLQRLSGNKFKEDYIPTQEIQVANVNWNYQGNGDVVKTEVWDIVDKSKKKRTPSGSLKITNDDTESEVKESNPIDGIALDAEFIDVYKGTHGVFLTLDMTKAWTWQYVQRELTKIPLHIPVLILANFRDMGDHRVVEADEILAYIEHLDRPSGSAEVYFTESSMKDSFGLQYVHNFLNMPFLMLQRETLMRQLEANTLEIDDVRERLSFNASSEQQNYDLFKEMLTDKVTLPQAIEADTVATNNSSPSTPSVETPPLQPKEQPQPSSTTPQQPSQPPVVVAAPEPALIEQQQQAKETPQTTSKFQAFTKLFSSKTAPVKEEPTLDISDLNVVPVEDFNPGELDHGFLDTATASTNNTSKQVNRKPKKLDSDDDNDGGNPMVAAYEDFGDSDSDAERPSNNGVAPVDDQGIQPINDESEDDFEDFSSDEEEEAKSKVKVKKISGEENGSSSIMEQIKNKKKLEKQRREEEAIQKTLEQEVVVSTKELDLNDKDYATLDSDVEDDKTEGQDNVDMVVQPVISTPPETPDLSSASRPSTTKVEKAVVVPSVPADVDESDEDDGTEANSFVIAGDVDVDESWMNHSSSDDDDDDVEDQPTPVVSKLLFQTAQRHPLKTAPPKHKIIRSIST
ncbi:rab-like protein 6 [Clytia hemisphaerica]|uniref:rab-like protein 6 n=1 Tax=Clytia hemisphaerica TaxID=252671 RepID=UPI0034D71947